MKIIIVGCGRVGRTLAEKLNNDGNDVTVIYMSAEKDNYVAEVAMQYNESYTENLLTFANNINTIEGGTHEIGFKTALTKVFNDYGRKYGIIKESEKNLSRVRTYVKVFRRAYL